MFYKVFFIMSLKLSICLKETEMIPVIYLTCAIKCFLQFCYWQSKSSLPLSNIQWKLVKQDKNSDF